MKYVCFDIGNVLCKVDFDNFTKEISKTLNLTIEDVNYFLNRSTKLHDLGLTSMSDELRDHLKIKSPVIVDGLLAEWNKTIIANRNMIDLLHALYYHDKCQIALLSNIGTDHAALIKHIIPLDIYTNCIKFFSSDVGARKPSYLYYKTFLDMYPEFRGSLYVDDRKENLEAGIRFGFKCHHFELDKHFFTEEFTKSIKEIRNLI